jgi:hypothetical protein
MKRLFLSLKIRERTEKKSGEHASSRSASRDNPEAVVHGEIRFSSYFGIVNVCPVGVIMCLVI